MKQLLIIINLFVIQNIIAQVKFERVYGGKDYDYAYSVTQTFDKGYVVVGATTSFGSGGTDGFILKTDSLGVVKWHKMYGGINIDRFYSVTPTKDSALIIAGYSNSYGNNGYQGYILKTDSLGGIIWSKTYGGNDWEFIYCIDITNDGGYVMCGGTYSYGNGDEDMYLVKLNANGDTLWTKTYGGTKEDCAKSVVQTQDGGYILTGYTKSFGDLAGDIYTVKTNATGDTLWTKREINTGKDIGNDVIQKNNGEYIIAGNMTIAGDQKGVAIDYTSSGNYILTNNYDPGTIEDGINSVMISKTGRIAVYGYTHSIGGGGGDLLWYRQTPFSGGTMGGGSEEIAYCVNKTEDNGFIICGTSKSFPTGNTFERIYLIKTDSNNVASGAGTTVVVTLTGIKDNTTPDSYFQIYPNPSDDFINIYTNNPINSPSIIITDVNGRECINSKLNGLSSNFTIPANTLANGMYFLTIITNQLKSTQKLIIQR